MSEKQLERVRRICSELPETTERLSIVPDGSKS